MSGFRRTRQDLLLAEIMRQGRDMGGNGTLTVTITFRGGEPRSVEILERRPRIELQLATVHPEPATG